MTRPAGRALLIVLALTLWSCTPTPVSQAVPVDLSGYSPAAGVQVREEDDQLTLRWRMDGAEFGHLALDMEPARPLIAAMGTATDPDGPAEMLLQSVEPFQLLRAGTRKPPGYRPRGREWEVFFDKPSRRPYHTYASSLIKRRARVSSVGRRTTVSIGDLVLGAFRGELQVTVYDSSRLVHVEAVVSTTEDERAILYDSGLLVDRPGRLRMAWMDTAGRMQRTEADPEASDRSLAVRHRTIVAETDRGSVACFPPPHQFHFPRDWTENLEFVWFGREHGRSGRMSPAYVPALPFGFGVRQEPDGGRAFEPWFNAPPGTRQRLGVFFLLSRGGAEDALREALRYTNGDRFSPLPGHLTLTSHLHLALAVSAMEGNLERTSEYARTLREMGIQAVHLADFHGDGHPKDAGPLRLPELEALFAESRRLSDPEFLMIPGEEINEYLGLTEPGKHPGHWMSLFPRPVYWIQRRGPGEPFVESHPRYGTVYRVGSRQDMIDLVGRERGLVWSSHPRIKASSWTPDIFRNEDFFIADFWLGGAWKAMPADLSRERLGERVLDLLSDMANWGRKKYVPGEVDVFRIDRTHELYGHMNVNYMRLERLPTFDEGWQAILDTLRAGRFFVTTGEVLIREFNVGGRESGDTLRLEQGKKPELRATLQWTFPMRFAEVVSGDGERVYRERIDLADTRAFDHRTLTLTPDLRGRRWVRLEAWDVAVNGAFTQPVWIEAVR